MPQPHRSARAVRWYRRLLIAYPSDFRARFAVDLEELFADLYQSRAADRPLPRRLAFWIGVFSDTLRQGVRERVARRRRLPLGAHYVRGRFPMSEANESLCHAVRALRQQPVLSAVIVMTLGLAIGANSAIFTVVNAVLLRPLPFADPDRVVWISEVDPSGRDNMVSIPTFEDLRQSLTTMTGLSVMAGQTANLTGVAEPDRLRGGFVTAGFFDMLGVQPIIGRAFRAGEDRSPEKTAVLTYLTWHRRFGADPAVVGRAMILNNESHEIIGVLPRGFEFPIDDIDVWMPYSSYPVQDRQRDSRNTFVVGRVRSDVSFDEALVELRQAAANLAQAYPETNRNWSARFEPFHDMTVRFVRRNLQLLAGAVAFVLLIACANIANLLLARASARQREMAVRAALGASRARLVRQLLLESLLVAIAGGALGLVLGAALTDGMLALVPNLPRAAHVAPDVTVVAFTALLSIATGLAFGILPALRTSRLDLRSTLSEGARGGESRATGRLRAVLVVAELALSLVLLVGAGLFIRSVTRLLTVELGYDPSNLLTLEYRLPRNKYQTSEQQWTFHRRVIDEVGQVPGVQVASLARAVPQSGNGGFVAFWRAEDSRPLRDAMPRAQYNAVSADYFRVMSIPLLEGRVCTTDDTADRPLTLMVNRLLADRLWPGTTAVGKRLSAPDFPAEGVVVGIVGNTRPQLLSQPMGPQIYGCLSQQPGIFVGLIAKTAGEPMALARSVQQAIWSVDPDQPMWKIRSSESMVLNSVQTPRFVMLLMSFAASLALLLAGLGTYSVLSYTVQRRAREVGVRMALGATRAQIARLVLGQTVLLTASGIGVGLLGATALARLLTTQLYDISPRDPMTLATTAMTLATIALIAAWLPTRRAASVDPVVTLRAE
jgi:putative ABC transport system permease protein